MGYLDNTSITVDAVLTKRGREILKNGGSLDINSFTVSDTGVDYTLWNPDHPSGSAFYGEAIENLPMLEASVHAEYNLRNRLVSLNQNTKALPVLTITGLDKKDGTTLTFNEGDDSKGNIVIDLLGYSSTGQGDKIVVVQDPSVVSLNIPQRQNLSGTGAAKLTEQDIPFAAEYELRGNSFKITPLQQNKVNQVTSIHIIDVETAAEVEFTVTNNVLKNTTSLLSTNIRG
jgi:hypothetical protein